MNDVRLPAIVGGGQIAGRGSDGIGKPASIDLMARRLKAAERDSSV